MPQKKTFLFFAIEDGLAHIVRSLAVAEELQKHGHEIHMALPTRRQEDFARSPVEFVEVPPYSEHDSMEELQHLFHNAEFEHHLRRELELMSQMKPHAVVIDFRYTAAFAALALHIPVFSIANSTAIPAPFRIPIYPPLHFLTQQCRPLLNILIEHIRYGVLNNIRNNLLHLGYDVGIEQLRERMINIIPEHPEYLQSANHDLHAHYVPFIAWKGFSQRHLPASFRRQNKKKRLYVTFGGTGFDYHKMIHLSHLLAAAGYDVIVTCGTLARPTDFPRHENLHVERFLPSQEVLKEVDLMICHGGYNTMYEAAHAGIPVIVIPFNPDQLIHGLRMQELGIARCLTTFGIQDIPLMIRGQWATFQRIGKTVTDKEVLHAVEDVFHTYESYQADLKKYAYMFAKNDGAQKAADLIERLTV